jgi:hypothetical protein
MLLEQEVGGMRRVAFVVFALLLAAGGCVPGVPITGEQLVITSFNANPLSIAPGESSTLTWAVEGANHVEIDPGVGSVALNGSRVVTPSATTVYTLVASNAAGKTASVTVHVVVSGAPSPSGAPVVNSFGSSPSTISPGGSATLTWTVSNAMSVSIDHGVGSVASTGSTTVSPTATTTYLLTATNASGSTTATTVVAVTGTTPTSPPVIVEFVASPPSIHPGETTMLSWRVTGATSVAIDRGIGAVDSIGSAPISITGTTNYTLTASNSFGHVSRVLHIVVNPWPEPGEGGPDLVVTAIAKVTGSGGYRIGYVVTNEGGDASPPTTSKLYVEGVYKASDSVPSLNGGASMNRVFTSWTYNPTTIAIEVIVDANDDVHEEDEDNNEKAVSVTAEVLADFVEKANLAEWRTGTPSTDISFGGATNDANGFACYRTSVKLEDGDTYAKVLETHPKWVANGWIDGFYPVLTVPSGAWFVADVGFINGATGTDGVTFRVWFWQDGSDIPNVLDDVDAEYDGDMDRLEINLASIVGRTGRIGLQVLAGPSSSQDWAVWANAKMIR